MTTQFSRENFKALEAIAQAVSDANTAQFNANPRNQNNQKSRKRVQLVDLSSHNIDKIADDQKVSDIPDLTHMRIDGDKIFFDDKLVTYSLRQMMSDVARAESTLLLFVEFNKYQPLVKYLSSHQIDFERLSPEVFQAFLIAFLKNEKKWPDHAIIQFFCFYNQGPRDTSNGILKHPLTNSGYMVNAPIKQNSDVVFTNGELQYITEATDFSVSLIENPTIKGVVKGKITTHYRFTNNNVEYVNAESEDPSTTALLERAKIANEDPAATHLSFEHIELATDIPVPSLAHTDIPYSVYNATKLAPFSYRGKQSLAYVVIDDMEKDIRKNLRNKTATDIRNAANDFLPSIKTVDLTSTEQAELAQLTTMINSYVEAAMDSYQQAQVEQSEADKYHAKAFQAMNDAYTKTHFKENSIRQTTNFQEQRAQPAFTKEDDESAEDDKANARQYHIEEGNHVREANKHFADYAANFNLAKRLAILTQQYFSKQAEVRTVNRAAWIKSCANAHQMAIHTPNISKARALTFMNRLRELMRILIALFTPATAPTGYQRARRWTKAEDRFVGNHKKLAAKLSSTTVAHQALAKAKPSMPAPLKRVDTSSSLDSSSGNSSDGRSTPRSSHNSLGNGSIQGARILTVPVVSSPTDKSSSSAYSFVSGLNIPHLKLAARDVSPDSDSPRTPEFKSY